MQFRNFLENETAQVTSWNSYGDLVIYINGIKYIYFTGNREIAKKAYEQGKFNGWAVVKKMKDLGIEFMKDDR